MKKELIFPIHNRFDVVLSDAATGEVIQTGTGYNTILNNFFSAFLQNIANGSTTAPAFSGIAIGEGVVEPLPTDTNLTAYLGAKAVTDIQKDFSTLYTDGIIKRTSKVRFEASEYAGKYITEVGLRNVQLYSALKDYTLTKSLITDSNGNPVAIYKTDLTVLDIYSTFFCKIPLSYLTDGDVHFNFPKERTGFLNALLGGAFNGQSYFNNPVIVSPFKATSETQLSLDVFSNENTGNVEQPYKTATSKYKYTYDTAQKKFSLICDEFSAGDNSNNVVGISAILFADTGIAVNTPNITVSSPTITKEVLGTGDGTTKDFKCKYGRIKNDGVAKLFVNDVEVAATFDYDYPRPSENTLFMFKWTGLYLDDDPVANVKIMENVYWDKETPIQALVFPAITNHYYWCSDTLEGPYERPFTDVSYTTRTVPAQYQNKRYWYCKWSSADKQYHQFPKFPVVPKMSANLVVHAEVPPPAGSTVALTYNTPVLPKDANSVLRNFSLEITLAEYTE